MLRLERNGDYWRAVGRDPTGARVARGLGHVDRVGKKQAMAELRRLEAEMIRAGAAAKEPPRLGDWCKDYIESRRGSVADGSLTLLDITARHLQAVYGAECRMDRITRDHAARFRAHFEDRTESTIRGHIRRARQIFEEARRRDRIAINPFDREKCSEPKGSDRGRYMPITELDRLLDAAINPGWRCLWALCRLAGCRRGEALGMEWGAIDWDRRVLRPDGKTGERTTPIQPKLLALLREAFDAAPAGSVGPCDGVGRNNLHTEAIAQIKAAGLPVYRKPFHALRGSLVTDWQATYPPLDVAKWLGHSVQVAADHYHETKAETIAKVTGGESELDRLRRELAEAKAMLAEKQPR